MSHPSPSPSSAMRRLIKAAFPSLVKKVRHWLDLRKKHRSWEERIAVVKTCPDNERLPRVKNAGEIRDGYQIMHNGIQVVVDGYYGSGITRMLAANRGCHEPQEEVVFDAVVRTLPPGSVMIEAGAYWAFYSMWFCQVVDQPRVFLIEPAAANLQTGRANFSRNRYSGEFTQGYVGAAPGVASDGIPVIAIDPFAAAKGLTHIAVLHADVQAFEVEMLGGCQCLLSSHQVDYFFISTHTDELHQRCTQMLEQHGYRILVSVDQEETYSLDGILVACSPTVKPPVFEHPSRKSRQLKSKKE